MTKITEAAAEAAIVSAATTLFLPTVRAQAGALADAAARDRLTHRGYLAELLATEVDDRTERRRLRRVKEARFPRLKQLDDFDLAHSPVDTATLAALTAGTFIDKGTPPFGRLRNRQNTSPDRRRHGRLPPRPLRPLRHRRRPRQRTGRSSRRTHPRPSRRPLRTPSTSS